MFFVNISSPLWQKTFDPDHIYQFDIPCTSMPCALQINNNKRDSSENVQNITSLLPEWLWSINLAGLWITMRDSCTKSHKNLSWYGLGRSHDKLKTLYLHYHSAYGHQTLQDGNVPRWAPTHKVTWPFQQVVLWDHVTN